MKIKKKEYQKQLNDRFWEGVNAGMKFALNNPEEAKKYVDRTEALRTIIERTSKAFEGLTNAINKLFGGEK
jgi:hypothetical protein